MTINNLLITLTQLPIVKCTHTCLNLLHFSQGVAKIATMIVRFTSLTARKKLIKIMSTKTARRRVTFVLKVISLFSYHWKIFPPHSGFFGDEPPLIFFSAL